MSVSFLPCSLSSTLVVRTVGILDAGERSGPVSALGVRVSSQARPPTQAQPWLPTFPLESLWIAHRAYELPCTPKLQHPEPACRSRRTRLLVRVGSL